VSRDVARQVLDAEAEAIRNLMDTLGGDFDGAVKLITSCTGRVVLTGMGKSGIICRKIAATMSSTGTPALFIHPAEATHGDLGMVTEDDLVVAISQSGTTEEVIELLRLLRRLGVTVIAITSNPGSPLAEAADLHLDLGVRREACPMNLAPTASTTASLALGDALAMAVSVKKGFRDTAMKDVIYEMSRKALGMTTVQDSDGRLLGVITDGDLRRLMERDPDPLAHTAEEVMHRGGACIHPDELATAALKLLEEKRITSLMVCDGEAPVLGVLHLHDLWGVGLF